jgi:hypothetical protein
MVDTPRPFVVSDALSRGLREIQSASVTGDDARHQFGRLLQAALQLEFATVPTYLSAAFSLVGDNQAKLRQLIMRIAKEEMLHMTVIANLMNAIGVAPDVRSATPTFPYNLELLEPTITINLCSFSLALVKDLFMRIEAPENPIEYPQMAGPPLPHTIGQFYAGIIQVIADETVPDLFKNAERDGYKQRRVPLTFAQVAYLSNQDNKRYPLKPDIDLVIKDKASAVRHLSWIVGEGEGAAPFNPLSAEGLPGHYYRFLSIIKTRYLIKDPTVPNLGYSYSGGDIPFSAADVHGFDVDAKVDAYGTFPAVQAHMQAFNAAYTDMINSLQTAFNCADPDQAAGAQAGYTQAIRSMRALPDIAESIVREAQAAAIKAGIPFEYGGPPIA